MHNLPVHWSEGMFLLPHHLQAADEYWNEVIQTVDRWNHPHGYGIYKLDINHDAIANHHFQVSSCYVRMKDGTLVVIEGDAALDRIPLKESLGELQSALEPLRVDLKSSLEVEPVVKVYLAVPKLKIGAVNVAPEADDGKHRYTEIKRQVQDQSQGGNDQEIALKALGVRLLLSTEELTGYEYLPIAQIQRSGERGHSPTLDVRYIPPLLTIDSWPPLGRDIVRSIYDIIGKKIEILTEQVLHRGITLASHDPGDLDRVFMLAQLNEAYATLGSITFTAGSHPLTAYQELARIVGKLSIFSKERRLPEIPLYDHDDLAIFFYWVKAKIIALLDTVRDYEYERQQFVGVGLGMQVTLAPKWFSSDWKWYVAVSHENLNDQECRELLAPTRLDWKLGSQPDVENLFRLGRPGLHLVPLDRTPRALPLDGKWNFYEVSRESAAWKDVQATQTLAMRLRESLIVNRNELQGQHKLVVNFDNKRAVLEFALYAVRTQT